MTLDRRRRPIELSIGGSGAFSAGVPPALQKVLGRAYASGSAADMAGRRWELGARLDLRDPLVRAAWARFRAASTSRAAIASLAQAIRDRAYLDVRVYATDNSATGAAAGIAEGVTLGGEYDRVTERARLLTASSRPPAGLWERRLDCAAA